MTNVAAMTGDVGRTIAAAVHDATAAKNGLAVAAALNCVEPEALAGFFHASLAADVDAQPLATGLPASPGAATGRIVLTADAAIVAGEADEDVILIRRETTPDDVLGMQAAGGILTTRGGLVSHAAVVARGWGIPAVVGRRRRAHRRRTRSRSATADSRRASRSRSTAATGHIYAGALATSSATAPTRARPPCSAWADVVAAGHVEVRANADTDGDASVGRRLGAQGIGLCRTEHMFLAADRLPIMRRFILGHDPSTEGAALAELETAQTTDFETLLEAMDSLPVTVRLLDPPLHEFLPDLLDLTAREARPRAQRRRACRARRRAASARVESDDRHARRAARHRAQRALRDAGAGAVHAAANLIERGMPPHVEIMIPLVVDAEELRHRAQLGNERARRDRPPRTGRPTSSPSAP